MFFLIKNIRLSVWRTKDINIGGKNLTDINFASIDNFYIEIMKFPPTFFESEAFTTNELFDFVHKFINVKIHLHHSHITSEIKGYLHDF